MFGFYFSYSLAPLWDGSGCEGVSAGQPPPIRESYQPDRAGDLLVADASLPDPVYRTYWRLRWLAGGRASLAFTDQDFQAQFGVSRRTLYRHLALLAQLGALVYRSSRGEAIRDYRVEFPQDARWLSAVEVPASAKFGMDLTNPVTRIDTQEESGVKVGTLTTTSTTTIPSFYKNNLKNPKKRREEVVVNLNSAKPGNGCGVKNDNVAGDANGEDRPDRSAQESPGEAYPLTLAQASCHSDIQLYQQITDLFPGKHNWGAIIDAISLLRQRHPGEDLEALLTPYWQAWQKGRRKDESPFDGFSLPWLTEWALSGAIPNRSPVESPHAPSPMDVINRRRAAMAAAKNEAATSIDATDVAQA